MDPKQRFNLGVPVLHMLYCRLTMDAAVSTNTTYKIQGRTEVIFIIIVVITIITTTIINVIIIIIIFIIIIIIIIIVIIIIQYVNQHNFPYDIIFYASVNVPLSDCNGIRTTTT